MFPHEDDVMQRMRDAVCSFADRKSIPICYSRKTLVDVEQMTDEHTEKYKPEGPVVAQDSEVFVDDILHIGSNGVPDKLVPRTNSGWTLGDPYAPVHCSLFGNVCLTIFE